MSRAERSKALKAAYGTLYSQIAALFCEADPIGLIKIGAPDDEYDPEISTILPRLHEANSSADVQRVVHEEFARLFGADTAGPITSYANVSEKIWETWLRFKAGT